MTKPEHHIFVCGSFRVSGEPQGVCNKKGSIGLMQYLESELSDRGMSNVAVSATGCLKACDRGPIMIVYPENLWYGKIDSNEAVDAVLDAIEENRAADSLLLS